MHNDICDAVNDRFQSMAPNELTTPCPYELNSTNWPQTGATVSENIRHASSGLYTSPRKLQVALNPRFVSKFSSSLRMRPYFIPQRSRTKSETNVETTLNYMPIHYPELIPADDDDDSQPSTSAAAAASGRLHHRNSMMTIDDETSVDPLSDISHHHHHQNNHLIHHSHTPHHLQQQQSSDASAMASTRSAATMAMLLSGQPQAMRKSRSMEDICRGVRALDAGSQASHEMEFMSTRIQKMKVQDN